VFENFLHNYDDPQYLQTQATMTSTNDIIQQKSFEMVKCLSGEMVISNSIASFMCKRCSFETSCMHHFNKESNSSHGHCNGTRNIITEMTPRVIKAEKLSANA
jgi:hypothetical protein